MTDARRVSALAAAGDEGHTNLREQRGKIKWQTAEDIEGWSVQVSLKERDRLSLWIKEVTQLQCTNIKIHI